MDVAWPVVKDRLVELFGFLLPAATVYDGPVPSGDTPTAFVTVGWQPSTDDVTAGPFQQELGPDGYQLRESGAVLCEFGAVTGDTDIPDAFGMFATVAGHVRSNQTLGVLSQDATVGLVAEVAQAQSTEGAAQLLLVQVTYTTRL